MSFGPQALVFTGLRTVRTQRYASARGGTARYNTDNSLCPTSHQPHGPQLKDTAPSMSQTLRPADSPAAGSVDLEVDGLNGSVIGDVHRALKLMRDSRSDSTLRRLVKPLERSNTRRKNRPLRRQL